MGIRTDQGRRDREAQDPAPDDVSPAIEELVRAATRLVLGSTGIAFASAARWQRQVVGESGTAAAGAETLASAALALGLRTQRVLVRGASAAGSTAASVTWGVVMRAPAVPSRLAEQFRSERRLSRKSRGDRAILEVVSEAMLAGSTWTGSSTDRARARVDADQPSWLAGRIADDSSAVR
jgi:hypothetical protein